jgi:acetoin utilization deacetylase AcuC-like enzyme
MKAVHSPLHRLHAPPDEIAAGVRIPTVETPARAEAILAALRSEVGFEFLEPTEHGESPITAVHDPAMVRFLEGFWDEWRRAGRTEDVAFPDSFMHAAVREGMGPAREPIDPVGRLGYWCFETMTGVVEGTYAAARSAVDVALTAADLVLGGERAAYGLCRPPGHHSPRAGFGGYCFFNNAAITAQYLVDLTGEPVAVLDVDYHHGNGTQQIFYARRDVLYVSLHGDPDRAYPFFAGHADETGASAGEGANLNIPLPAGCSDEEYLAALAPAMERIAAVGGSSLVVSLGLDTYRDDPICDFALTTAVYAEIGRRVAASGRRLIILQEGGYFVPNLGENVVAWLRGVQAAARGGAVPSSLDM